MATLYNRAGEPVEVPDEQAHAALASGEFGLPKGRVNVRTPEGEAESVPSENVVDALGKGYALENAEQAHEREEERKYGNRPIAAGAAGAGRGLTFGLSDLALTKSGLVKPEALEGLEKYNSVATKVGEYGAVGASLLVPGLGEATAVGAAGKVGHLAEKVGERVLGGGALAKIATGALATGAESGLYNLGNTISESALGDTELTAQKLVSGFGAGALAGGLLGGGLRAGGLGLSSVFGRRAADAAADVVGEAGAANEAGAAVASEAAPAAKAAQEGAEVAAERAPFAAKPGRFPGVADLTEKALRGEPVGKILEGEAEKHTPTIKRVMEALDLQFPTKENWVLRDLDLQRNATQKLREKGLHETAPRMLLDDARYAEAKTLPQKLQVIVEKKNEAAQKIGESVAKFDSIAAPEEAFDTAAVAQKIRDQIIAPLERGPALNRSIIERVEAEAAKIEEAGSSEANGLTFEQAEQLKRDFDPHLNWEMGQSADSPTQAAIKKVRGIINGEIESKVSAIADRTGDSSALTEWKEAKKAYGAMKQLERPVEKRVSAREANRYTSLTDNILGAGAMAAGGGFNPVGMALGGAAALGNKWARERLPQIIALALNRMDSSAAVSMAAKSFAERVSETTAAEAAAAAEHAAVPLHEKIAGHAGPSVASVFGQYREILAQAAARGERDLMATHVALSAADPGYREQMAMAGFADETGAEAADATTRAHRLTAIAAAVAAHDAQTDLALNRFLGKQSGAAPQAPQAQSRDQRLEEFTKQSERLNHMAVNPNALAAAVAPHGVVAASAPSVAAASAATAARALQYLQSRLPQDPHPEVLPALKRDWKPSDAELLKWNRTLRAVNDPQSVLADMKRGTISRESVEALRAVYPRLLQDLQQKTMERLAAHDKPVTYAQRKALATLMGSPTGGAGSPARTAVFQQAHAAAQRAKANADAQHSMKLAQGMTTEAQRIEGR